MAQDSKRKRHLRRLKRENTLAYKGLEQLMKERDYYRAIATKLAEEFRKLKTLDESPLEGVKDAQFTIKSIPDDTIEGVIMAGDTTPTPVEDNGQANQAS